MQSAEPTDQRFTKPELIQTNDGSHSLFLPALNETYHSRHGAESESQYVYINHGLDDYLAQQTTKPAQIQILEIGFGTGLNIWLAAQWARKQQIRLLVTTLEPYPIPAELVSQLNYGQADKTLFNTLHQAEWGKPVLIEPNLILLKLKTTLEQFELLSGQAGFDVLFYDAFGPSKQPEMWTADLMVKCHQLLKPAGLLTTYAAQGQFKRNLKAAGFEVRTLDGPLYKKEMTQGFKPASSA